MIKGARPGTKTFGHGLCIGAISNKLDDLNI